MKIVLSLSEASKWTLVNTNVKNLLALDDTLEIAVVAFSEGVTVFDQLEEKLNPKATFYLCNNAIEVREVNRDKLPSEVKIVPSGVYQIALLQENGFKYVRP